MHPNHQNGQFIVPRRDDSPDVGVAAVPYLEPLADEIAEAASGFLSQLVANTGNLAVLVSFGLVVVKLVERRAAADIEDFARPLPVQQPTASAKLTPEQKRRLVSAELGRIFDWICKGRPVLDMGPRAAVVASHIRREAINGRTDQQLALEIGNDTRASANKIKADFRRSLGADYAGENGKGTNTKTRCKKARLTNLQPGK